MTVSRSDLGTEGWSWRENVAVPVTNQFPILLEFPRCVVLFLLSCSQPPSPFSPRRTLPRACSVACCVRAAATAAVPNPLVASKPLAHRLVSPLVVSSPLVAAKSRLATAAVASRSPACSRSSSRSASSASMPLVTAAVPNPLVASKHLAHRLVSPLVASSPLVAAKPRLAIAAVASRSPASCRSCSARRAAWVAKPQLAAVPNRLAVANRAADSDL